MVLKKENKPQYVAIDMEISAYSIDALVFPLALLTIIYLSINIYEWENEFQKDFQKILVIVTNGFGIFPAIVADGIFLKFMILGAMITSFWAHMNWEEFKTPGFESNPGKWDNAFSVGVIIAYTCTFFPDRWSCNVKYNKKRTPRFIKETFYEPEYTNSCSLPLNLKTLLQIIFTTTAFIIVALYYEDNIVLVNIMTVGFGIPDVICIIFVLLALIFGVIYTCNTPEHLISKTAFIIYILLGIALALTAIISKKTGEKSELKEAVHSIWHICIFTAAYCISRAHSYIKKIKK